jgi:hypothetical protein
VSFCYASQLNKKIIKKTVACDQKALEKREYALVPELHMDNLSVILKG